MNERINWMDWAKLLAVALGIILYNTFLRFSTHRHDTPLPHYPLLPIQIPLDVRKER